MRRTAFPAASIAVASASVAATLVPALVASTVFAIAELAFVPVSAMSFAIDAIAWRPTLLAITRFPCRRAIRCGGGCNSAIRRRLTGTKFAEITVTVAPSMPVTFAFGAVACFARHSFTGGSRLRALGSAIGATMPIAIVTLWPTLVRPATGTPDFDQFGLRGCCGRVSRRSRARACRFRRGFRTRLDRRFGGNRWRHSPGLVRRCCALRRRFGGVCSLREIDRGQQRR